MALLGLWRPSFPFTRQWDAMDCGPACLDMVARYYGRETDRAQLRQWSHLERNGSSFAGLKEAAEKLDFRCLPIEIGYSELRKEAPFPCILHWENKHFMVLYGFQKGKVVLGDPAQGIIKVSFSKFLNHWLPHEDAQKGFALLLEPNSKSEQLPHSTNATSGFSRLWGYFKGYRTTGLQLGIGLLFSSLTQLALPFLTQALVDYGVQFQDLHFVYMVLLAQVVFFVSLSSVEIIRGWLLLQLTQQINLRLVSDYLERLLRLPIPFFASKHSGDIIQRIQDNRKVQEFVSSQSLGTLFSMVTLLAFGLVFWYYHTQLALVFILTLLGYGFWSLYFLKRLARWDYQRFQRESETQRTIWQLVRGITAIKDNRSEHKRRGEWVQLQRKLFSIQGKQLSLSQKQRYGALFVHQLGSLVLLFLSARLVISGQLTLGSMLSIQFILGQIGLPLGQMAQFFVEAQAARLSLERMQEVHAHPLEPMDGTVPDMKGSIGIQNLSFRYGPASQPLVLEEVSFTIAHGKTTALVGASGSGKTTLLKLLLGHYDNYSGTIQVGETELKKLAKDNWRDVCGSVMQEGFLFEDTLLSNITESGQGRVDDKRLEEALSLSRLQEMVKALPLGLQTNIGAEGTSLSGGERQRVLLARALYKRPGFFFLDEATSAMDTQLEREVMDGLQRFRKGRTVLVIAHRMSTVRNAEHIVVLDKGKVVERGSHDELVARKQYYYKLVQYQLEVGA
ncbi:peptidase domain-containing ABC transporter [Croceitalea sp. MTPC9]|uniref:peptidase domain-containing ABC transporter n=1 Tax=unclassified Croceitalea TaxID=2632280 RepID=UPI002B3EDCED|nr:peptidase domain-containing ABC transporter [Croceitalea sp. MTPC6]GMN16131.1 peptidase domain-containing ABC transporter [Croceitalea sp. MTPC9]